MPTQIKRLLRQTKTMTDAADKKNSAVLRADSEMRANQWLARANELQEAGKDDSKALAKAQYWLDKLNEADGMGED